MKKTLSYPEIYTVLSRLADPQMLFINLFKENPNNNLISSIIYFPYTPQIIENINPTFIISLCKYLGIFSDYNYLSENEKIKILKQKLIDLYYLVDDSEDLHGITPCMSVNKCDDIASFYCENNMCKNCCEKTTIKEFCIIHDNLTNFYRKKMQEILEFEHMKNFDRSRTVRISVRQRITKSELKSIFEGGSYSNLIDGNPNLNTSGNISQSYNINWDNIEFLFRKGVEKIQFIYLQCATNDDAKRLYEDRGKLIKKWEKLEINIQSLMESIPDIISRLEGKFENSGILVVPCSSLLSNNKKIPKKSNRNKVFSELIEKCLNINSLQYKISNCNNKINDEFSYDYFLVEFKSKNLLDQFYNSQPFIDSTIFHKLAHLKIFPLLRNKLPYKIAEELCINCQNNKSKSCKFELCIQCCSHQSSENNMILASLNSLTTGNITSGVSTMATTNTSTSTSSKLASICPCSYSNSHSHSYSNTPNTPNQLSEKVYNSPQISQISQTFEIYPTKTPITTTHLNTNSFYFNHIFNTTNFSNFIKSYQLNISLTKLKLMTNLRNGEFHWFRPIEQTNYTRMMLDMNKECQIIMDNPNFRREGPLRINDKMYKIFTYQHEMLMVKNYEGLTGDAEGNVKRTIEGFDHNGEYYVEYDFDSQAGDEDISTPFPNSYVPATADRLESIDSSLVGPDICDIANSLKMSYHIGMFGLDVERHSTYDLVEEIYQELKAQFVKVNKDGINVLDEGSIISK